MILEFQPVDAAAEWLSFASPSYGNFELRYVMVQADVVTLDPSIDNVVTAKLLQCGNINVSFLTFFFTS